MLSKEINNKLYRTYIISAILAQHRNDNNITPEDYELSKTISPIINIIASQDSSELNFIELFESNNYIEKLTNQDLKQILENINTSNKQFTDLTIKSITDDVNKLLIEKLSK